ncbi:MAG: hypothetical protein IPH81_03045 [Candidatus Microthrix sp.]|nr:hypothetical protein [Candidatus Microthrix sp.]
MGLKLSTYDGIVVATNACNDTKILNWLTNNSSEISTRLAAGDFGLLVNFQMALSDRRLDTGPFPFLDERYTLTGHKRLRDGEQADQGTFSRPQDLPIDPILNLPNKIDLPSLEHQCRVNPNIPGLYWGYLEPALTSAYRPQIVDDAALPSRTLLMSSVPEGSRIIVSSLVVDWQGLGALWDNLIRYVVEGPKPVALVRRRGASGFDINLLDHSLRENKVPRQVVTLATPTGWQFDDGLFSAVVLDPTWNREEVHQFSSGLRRDKLKHKPGIHFFDSMGSGEMVSCTIPSVSDYQPILEGAIAWLQSQWGGDLWDRSFFSTVDVLDLLQLLHRDLSPFAPPVLAAISRHLQPNGSYDDVPGATCAALLVMTWLGAPVEKIEGATSWLLAKLETQENYNAATTLETFARLPVNPVHPDVQDGIVQRILDSESAWPPGLETLRYMNTLIEIGEPTEITARLGGLLPAARGADEWLTVFGTAEAVGILARMHSNLPDGDGAEELQRILFRGVEQLLATYDVRSGTWRESVPATAKAAKAIALFTNQVNPAVSDTIRSLTKSRDIVLRSSALERFQTRILEVSGDLDQQKSKLAAQEPLLRMRYRTENLAIFLFLASYTLALGLAVSLIAAQELIDELLDWSTAWRELAIPAGTALLLLPAYVVVQMLDSYGREPRWLIWGRKNLPFVKGIFGDE